MHSNHKSIDKQFLAIILLFLPLTAVYADVDFNSMLAAFTTNAGPIIELIAATAYVIGLWFIISAIQEMKTIGNMQAQTHGGIGGQVVKFVIGLLLMYLPSTIDATVWTMWGSDASIMAYNPGNASDPFGQAKRGAIAIVRVVGYISFVRGLIMLSHAHDQGGQQGSVGKGIAHLIGGILAINIVETITMIGNTFGISIF